MLFSFQVDELGEVLCGGVFIDEVVGFVLLLEHGQDRIVLVQDHLVIEIVIDPGLHDPFNFAEVDDHAELVELVALDGDDSDAIVPMQMATLTGVVEQAMAVAEVDFAGNSVHGILSVRIPARRARERLAMAKRTNAGTCISVSSDCMNLPR